MFKTLFVALFVVVSGCMGQDTLSNDCSLVLDQISACADPTEVRCFSGNTQVVGCPLSESVCVETCTKPKPAYEPWGGHCEDGTDGLIAYPCQNGTNEALCTHLDGRRNQVPLPMSYDAQLERMVGECPTYSGYVCKAICS